jgi:hypothetical protein
MIFLIHYNRSEGRIVDLRVYDDLERKRALDHRLELELDLNRRKVDHEVVLLEATNEEAIRRTHRRYFEDPGQIVRSGTETNH